MEKPPRRRNVINSIYRPIRKISHERIEPWLEAFYSKPFGGPKHRGIDEVLLLISKRKETRHGVVEG